VSDGWLGEALKKHLGALLATGVSLLFALVAYIILHSVSNPYWISGKQVTVSGECLHTYVVINPGPWATRRPKIQFPLEKATQIVDFSPGVSVEKKDTINQLWASMDDGLPAGCMYFVTFCHPYPTNVNNEPTVAVVCDAKPCKNAPTFDLDLSLKSMQAISLMAIFACAITTGMWLNSRKLLAHEKQCTTRGAIDALLSKEADREAVRESARSMGNLKGDLEKVVKNTRPKAVKNGGKAGTTDKPGNQK
jgi:hypothetical protein